MVAGRVVYRRRKDNKPKRKYGQPARVLQSVGPKGEREQQKRKNIQDARRRKWGALRAATQPKPAEAARPARREFDDLSVRERAELLKAHTGYYKSMSLADIEGDIQGELATELRDLRERWNPTTRQIE